MLIKVEGAAAMAMQVNGKLLVATTGGSPLKPSEVALLEADSVEDLISSGPDRWQVLRRASKAEVRHCRDEHRMLKAHLSGKTAALCLHASAHRCLSEGWYRFLACGSRHIPLTVHASAVDTWGSLFIPCSV